MAVDARALAGKPIDHYWTALKEFTREMLASKDIDPLYPVLRGLYELLHLNTEQRLWFSTLYVAYYNLPSALAAYRRIGDFPDLSPAVLQAHAAELGVLPTGIERRGLRGGAVVPYLHDFAAAVRTTTQGRAPVLRAWYTNDWTPLAHSDAPRAPYWNYERFWDQWQTVRGNGRWSAFKMAEILRRVHDLPLLAPDMRMEYCSGPKEGLIWLYDAPEASTVAALNRLGSNLRTRFRDEGVDLDWETLETVLCNFNSVRHGRYYVGHDIDELQEQIVSANAARGTLSDNDARLLYAARSLALPHHYLGEKNGWYGVQHDRMAAWKQHGALVVREAA